MHEYLDRKVGTAITARLRSNPVVALLGPRQAGKSTLAKHLLAEIASETVYLDLELPSDKRKLEDAETYLRHHRGKLICIDEVQREPELFPVLRSLVDESGRPNQFLVLGSASPELLRQGSESLAGRVTFVELPPFSINEVDDDDRLWTRGGFPRSYLASADAESFQWRLDFIRTFLERDMPQLGLRLPAESVRRMWQMLAHSQGGLLNSSKLGTALGISHTTVRSYIDLLVSTFLVRVLMPFAGNVKKRLVKSPKVYVRDTGILHALLELEDYDAVAGHLVRGHSWEGFVIENIMASLVPGWSASFYRSSHGVEIDLVLSKADRRIGIECKVSASPQIPRNLGPLAEELELEQMLIAAPVREAYPATNNIWVMPLQDLVRRAGVDFPV